MKVENQPFHSRLLLAKEKNPERWQRELEPMETHTAARQQRPTWGADQVNVADFLVEHCKLGDKFDKELVQRVCGILEVRYSEIAPFVESMVQPLCLPVTRASWQV